MPSKEEKWTEFFGRRCWVSLDLPSWQFPELTGGPVIMEAVDGPLVRIRPLSGGRATLINTKLILSVVA